MFWTEDSLFIFSSDIMIIKKLFFNLILVAAVIFTLDYAIGRALNYFYFKETAGDHYRTTYAMEKTNADILVVGSSRANHHYVPEIFEDSLKMNFYNAGRDANGIFYQSTLLKSVLRRYSPKLIIVDYFGDFGKNENVMESPQTVLPYYRTHEEVKQSVIQRGFAEKIKMLSAIYPYNSIVLSIAMGNLKSNRNLDIKGYIPLYEEWQSELDSVKDTRIIEIDSGKIEHFRELLAITKKSDARVLIVFSPIFQKAETRHEIDICKQICVDEKITFWDYSRDTLFLNDRHLFRDQFHLNDKGARIFSEKLVKRIKSEFIGNP